MRPILDISRRPRFRSTAEPRARRSGALAGAVAALCLAAALFGPLMARAGDAEAPAAVAALAAHVEPLGEKVRLAFDTTGPVQATAYPVARPDRIIVDLPELAFLADSELVQAGARPGKRADSLIKSYRCGLFAPGRSRIVIDLARPARVLRVESVAAPSGGRLEIDLAPSDAASFADAASEHARAVAADAGGLRLDAATPPGAKDDKPIVVIDPGHGGVDIGATGKHGEQEKRIVFDFAQALKEKIEAKGQLTVLLTRTTDVFVPLDERVRFARRRNAALFLSIHADTLGAASVEGATVYTVSARASDAEAARIAEKENLADQAAGLERKEDAEEVGDILYDLTRRETRAYSRDFAQRLVARWRDAGSLNKNPTRAAGFVVLKAHDVPSVLLELGYLSSEKDLSRLTSPEWRERAAETTAQAIAAFFSAKMREAQAPAAAPRPQ